MNVEPARTAIQKIIDNPEIRERIKEIEQTLIIFLQQAIDKGKVNGETRMTLDMAARDVASLNSCVAIVNHLISLVEGIPAISSG